MEPRQSENPVESHGAGQTAPACPPMRKRRFRIVKLEERIAPAKGGNGTNNCYYTGKCSGAHGCC